MLKVGEVNLMDIGFSVNPPGFRNMKELKSEKYFNSAVVRLATIQQRGNPGRLLFTTVTLLSNTRTPPAKMQGVESHRIGKSGATIYFRRVNMTANAAIGWYRSLEKQPKTPIPSNVDDVDEELDGIDIDAPGLFDDPIWPHIGLPIGEGLLQQSSRRTHPAPFIGTIPSRIHRQFGRQTGFENLLANDNALNFVARRLHINLRTYYDYLGSAVLIVPDPIIKQIDNFMIPAEGEQSERIFYRFTPKPRQTLNDLKLITFDEQAQLLTSFETHDVSGNNSILDIEKGSCTGAYGYVITHPELGILDYHPPTPFLRSISLNTHVLGASDILNVSVPMSDSPDAKVMNYTASSRLSPVESTIGERSIPTNAIVRVGKASTERDKKAKAKQYGQRWFDNGSREEAMRFIQGEIGKAQSQVIVADPYLGSLQLDQFLYAVNGDIVEVVLLTSSQAFSRPKSQSIDDFKKRLANLKKYANVSVDVHIIASTILHDRFLVIDQEAWFLGNSLNALGDKSSMIVKLPDPADVVHKLKAMLRQATSFEKFAAKQSKSKGND